MTISEMFDKYSDEYLEFERIPTEKRLEENAELCGLLYLYNLVKDPSKFHLEPAHDIIYLSSEFSRELTEDDVIYLRRCGIHWSDELDCPAMFT